MTIFLFLDGMGVLFLLYVLAKFWKEGHVAKREDHESAAAASPMKREGVIVMAKRHSPSGVGGADAVALPFRSRERTIDSGRKSGIHGLIEMPATRISTR